MSYHRYWFALINRSTLVSDDALPDFVDAAQEFCSQDMLHSWGQDAVLTGFGTQDTAPTWMNPVVILDDSDQAGAGGYHEEGPDGQPLAKIFARPYGGEIGMPLTHELAEAMVDPFCNQFVLAPDGKLYMQEVGDPFNAFRLRTVTVRGREIALSDFALPSWFNGAGAGPFNAGGDFGLGPFRPAAFGYTLQLNPTTHQINLVLGSQAPALALVPGSRRETCLLRARQLLGGG